MNIRCVGGISAWFYRYFDTDRGKSLFFKEQIEGKNWELTVEYLRIWIICPEIIILDHYWHKVINSKVASIKFLECIPDHAISKNPWAFYYLGDADTMSIITKFWLGSAVPKYKISTIRMARRHCRGLQSALPVFLDQTWNIIWYLDTMLLVSPVSANADFDTFLRVIGPSYVCFLTKGHFSTWAAQSA